MTQQWRFVQESKPIFADFDVAQVSNLLYRRFPIGKARFSEVARRFHALQAGSPAIQQVGNLRYERIREVRLERMDPSPWPSPLGGEREAPRWASQKSLQSRSVSGLFLE